MKIILVIKIKCTEKFKEISLKFTMKTSNLFFISLFFSFIYFLFILLLWYSSFLLTSIIFRLINFVRFIILYLLIIKDYYVKLRTVITALYTQSSPFYFNCQSIFYFSFNNFFRSFWIFYFFNRFYSCVYLYTIYSLHYWDLTHV